MIRLQKRTFEPLGVQLLRIRKEQWKDNAYVERTHRTDDEALALVYQNNVRFAERIFDCRLGRVQPGYAADLIMIPYDPPTPMHEQNLASHLVGALSLRVSTVLVAGRVVMREGQVLGVNEREVMARARLLAHALWERL